MKKLIVFAVFCLSQAAFGQIQAPYLYTADSIADSIVQLTWRNNSAAYVGIIVLRKAGSAGSYSVIDTAPGSATSLKDTVRPAAQTTYYYALTAYSQTEHADTGNADSVSITPKSTSILVSPQNLSVLYDTLTHTVQVQFYDSSTVETGYRIYKSTNAAAFEMIKDIVSSTPSQNGVISFADSSVSPNTWYQYYTVVYNSQQSLNSPNAMLFTFDIAAMAQSLPRKCTISNKLGSFPTRYKGWSLKSGDTIVLNETGAPDSSFSIINVSNPSAPIFAGTGQSPSAVIGKASLSKGPYIIGNSSPDTLFYYQYSSGKIKDVNHMIMPRTSGPYGNFQWPASLFPGFLSDTTFISMGTINYGTNHGFLWVIASQYLLSQNTLSFVDTTALYSGLYPLRETWILNNKIFKTLNGRFFLYNENPPFDSSVDIVDFNYSPKVKTKIYVHGQIEFPIIVDNILVDAPSLKNANNVIIDTVKNLVFAFSDTELDVYSCQIKAGVLQGIPLTSGLRHALGISVSNSGPENLIFIPRHTHPCALSIFDVSGRRIARMEGIRGETVAWPNQKRTGVYILRAIIDGSAVTAKVILNK